MSRVEVNKTVSDPYEFSLKPEMMERLKQGFVNRKTRKAVRKQAEALAIAKFSVENPAPVSKAEIKALNLELNAAMDRLEVVLRQRETTSEFINLYEMVPLRELSILDRMMGGVAAITLTAAMLTMPAIAGISIFEADKFPLLREMPILSLIFGLSPFAGILSAVIWRDTLGSDQARSAFDRTLLKSTVLVLIIWAVIAALTAFPIGGDLSAEGGYGSEAKSGFRLSIPPSVLLVWTAILDLVAAPTLHMIVEEKLFKKRPVGSKAHPKISHLDDTLIPKVRKEVARLTSDLKALRSIRKQHKNAEFAAVQTVLIELDSVEAELRMAHAQASAALFK